MKLFHRRTKRNELKVIVKKPEPEDVLKSLSGNDKRLYVAMSNFLLLDPRSQERMIGSIPRILEQGMKDLAAGAKIRARVNFEIAARQALFHQDRLSVEKALKLADQASEGEGSRLGMHQTILSNLDKAFSIADQFYKRIDVAKSDEKKNKESNALEVAPILVRK